MPGKEIKGRSKIANYRHGGRTGKQFGGPLAQPLARPGVAQPLARPGVAQPGVMPTRSLGLKDGGRTGFKRGGKKSETVKKQVKEAAAKTKEGGKYVKYAVVNPLLHKPLKAAKSAYDKYKSKKAKEKKGKSN
jgi:hypothetical protein